MLPPRLPLVARPKFRGEVPLKPGEPATEGLFRDRLRFASSVKRFVVW